MRKFKYFIISIVFLSGCSSTLKIQPIIKVDQESQYDNGIEFIMSSKNNSGAAVGLLSKNRTSTERMTFIVMVKNKLDQPTVFSTENITATMDNRPLIIFSYDELIAEIEKERQAQVAFAAFTGALQAASAAQSGYQYHSGSYTTNYYNRTGYVGSGYGGYTGYTYNPAAVQQVQQQAVLNTRISQNITNANANLAAHEAALYALKKETIFPNELHGGYIQLQKTLVPKSTNNIVLKIMLNGEEHVFEFIQSKLTKSSI